MTTKVPRGAESPLTPWLVAAAEGIAVVPADPLGLAAGTWGVEVNNGLGGHDGAGSIVARCHTEQDAELVAVALWALVDRATHG